MMFRPLLVCFLLTGPGFTFAANREMQELQRDVAQLQEQIKLLQRSQDEKFASITELARQAIEAANRANTGVAVISSNLDKSLKDQVEKVVTPVVGFSSRMDAMSGDMRSLQNAVTELTGLMSRMQAQLSDLNTTMKLIQTPPAAPPPQAGSGPGASAAPGANETPTISAADLYANARRDYNSGKIDLALQEFADYLKWYGGTELAPNAQFYVAMAHYSQKNYEDAAKEFDMVLEKYGDNTNKSGEALYYKGKSLVNSGRKTQGANEFQEVITRYPNTDQAKMACAARVELGLRCAASPANRSTAKRGKK